MTPERLNRLKTVAENRLYNIAVVLEDIQDPHNAAAAFRNLDAFGIQYAYLVFEKKPKFNPKQIGKTTSASSYKWLTFKSFSSTKAALKHLREQNFKNIGTVIADNATSLFEFSPDPYQKLAFWFGNETYGLSQTAIENMDMLITIPMFGMVQSLNLSVSVGIVLYHINLKLRENFRPDKQSAKKQLKEWIKR